MNWRATLAGVMLATAATASFTLAQAPAGGGQGGGQGGQGGGQGGGGGRGNFDPAQLQTRMMERLKEDLKATDDEWKVIEPKLAKVMTDQRDLRGGGGGRGGRGQGGGGGGGGNQPEPTTELGIALRDLRTALEAEGTSADDIGKKLSNLRAAREKATANLETSRKALKEVLTARQEAQLVLNGALE